MKKRISLLLALLMLLPCALLGSMTASAEGAEQPMELNGLLSVPRAMAPDAGIQPGSQVTVGATTQMNGYFATDLFGNNTADIDVRRLLHGYSTVEWLRGVGAVVNGTAVADVSLSDTAAGRTFRFTLNPDLTYNDGQPIVASDYVFSLLLASCPQVRAIGGVADGGELLLGYSAFASGESRAFSGVRLLSEREFSVTIDRRNLPYFYDLAAAGATPYPASVIAPDCVVRDDGAGAYVDGAFDAELLRQTLLDPATGYVFNPKLTSGPYSLDAYDAEAHQASFRANPRFLGNYEGQKPRIETLVFRQTSNASMVSELAAQQLDIINKLTDRTAAEAAQELAYDQQRARIASYERNGLAFLALDCAQAPTDSEAVRNAIARAIDKRQLALDALGEERGVPAHGYYGLGHWMLRESAGTTADAQPITGYEAMDALAIEKDIEAAKALLEGDGWTLNAQGEPYQAGDGVRHKAADGQLVPLQIRWLRTENNPIADDVQMQLLDSFGQLGIGLDVRNAPFAQLLSAYDAGGDNNAYLMATNFSTLFDPSSEFDDQTLTQLALDMRRTEPGDTASYMAKWLAFQDRFAQTLPVVPLYTNAYLDVFSPRLVGYDIGAHISWADAILYTHTE